MTVTLLTAKYYAARADFLNRSAAILKSSTKRCGPWPNTACVASFQMTGTAVAGLFAQGLEAGAGHGRFPDRRGEYGAAGEAQSGQGHRRFLRSYWDCLGKTYMPIPIDSAGLVSF